MSKIKMRPVQTANSLRRSYNKALGDEDHNGNPYASMYSQAFGGRSEAGGKQIQTTSGNRGEVGPKRYSTPSN